MHIHNVVAHSYFQPDAQWQLSTFKISFETEFNFGHKQPFPLIEMNKPIKLRKKNLIQSLFDWSFIEIMHFSIDLCPQSKLCAWLKSHHPQSQSQSNSKYPYQFQSMFNYWFHILYAPNFMAKNGNFFNAIVYMCVCCLIASPFNDQPTN